MIWLNIILSQKLRKIPFSPRFRFIPKSGIELPELGVSFLLSSEKELVLFELCHVIFMRALELPENNITDFCPEEV